MILSPPFSSAAHDIQLSYKPHCFNLRNILKSLLPLIPYILR